MVKCTVGYLAYSSGLSGGCTEKWSGSGWWEFKSSNISCLLNKYLACVKWPDPSCLKGTQDVVLGIYCSSSVYDKSVGKSYSGV